MSPQPDFRVYATLLDSYRSMVESEEVWLAYWGNSSEPPHTPEQFHWLQVEQFIDGLNRVDGVPSMPASKGTAFNELVDSLVECRAPRLDNVEKVRDEYGLVTAITCGLDGFDFTFPLWVVRELAGRYEGALCQYLTRGTMRTALGTVELYGYIDELLPDRVVDIKTTGRYEFPKFRHNAQHLVYPYCLRQEGMDIRRFDYDVVVFSKYGAPEQFRETYTTRDDDEVRLRSRVEELCGWLDEHRALITNDSVFGGVRPDGYVGVPVQEMDTNGLPAGMAEVIKEINNVHLTLQS